MQHSFWERTWPMSSQGSLGAIHSATFILGIDMAHAWTRTSVAFRMDFHAASLAGSLSVPTGLYEFEWVCEACLVIGRGLVKRWGGPCNRSAGKSQGHLGATCFGCVLETISRNSDGQCRGAPRRENIQPNNGRGPPDLLLDVRLGAKWLN